jgi:hypothetical protein
MKKLALCVVLSSFFAVGAFAQSKAKPAATSPAPMTKAKLNNSMGYGMAGCGLGSMAFGNQPGIIQVLATTTNGISANQTFGITTGTSNCTDSATMAKKTELFIIGNREAVERDIARGTGESVSSLAAIVGCADASAFGAELKRNYGTIFPSAAASANQVSETILNTAASSCSQG